LFTVIDEPDRPEHNFRWRFSTANGAIETLELKITFT